MKVDFSLKRKVLGLLCILWTIGFTFLLGVMAEGLRGGITIFLTRSIFIFIVPPYAIWMLPCLLTGVYQLFKKQRENINKIILGLGVVLSIIGCLIFFFSGILHYNPTVPHEHSLLAIIAGAGLVILLNGIWSVAKIKKISPLKIRPVLTVLMILFFIALSYSAVYGRPILYDPFLLFLTKGNTFESFQGASATLELKFVDEGDKPVKYLEIGLEKNESMITPSLYTNKQGVAVFKVPAEKYKIDFNTATFPKKFVLPEIWIELKEGETLQKVIKLQSK